MPALDPKEPSWLLLRHAERPPIPKGVFGQDVYLTPQGLKEAYAFGQQLHLPLGFVGHSPIPRCGQTAEQILQGANQPLKPEVLEPLFLAYFTSQEKAQWLLANRMVSETLSLQIAKKELEGLKRIDQGSEELLGLIFSKKHKGLNLFVTHDLLICLLSHHLLGKTQFDPRLWPGFLTGIWFFRRQGQTYFQLPGQTSIHRLDI